MTKINQNIFLIDQVSETCCFDLLALVVEGVVVELVGGCAEVEAGIVVSVSSVLVRLALGLGTKPKEDLSFFRTYDDSRLALAN